MGGWKGKRERSVGGSFFIPLDMYIFLSQGIVTAANCFSAGHNQNCFRWFFSWNTQPLLGGPTSQLWPWIYRSKVFIKLKKNFGHYFFKLFFPFFPFSITHILDNLILFHRSTGFYFYFFFFSVFSLDRLNYYVSSSLVFSSEMSNQLSILP